MIKSKSRLTHADRVLQYLKNKDQPLSAYDILEGMRSEGVAAATTVYRALDKLLSIGLVHKIESLNAWTVCCGSHNNKHLFLKYVMIVDTLKNILTKILRIILIIYPKGLALSQTIQF